ncbi:MAG: hypothetical protein JSW71_19675 [Gemmatimonadota bacterium]|nr:MAG: hypothetical protein JSW71_19675 [Gemmatimonadota bacterium]
MTRTDAWARLWAIAGASRLRSGAWYPVTKDDESGTVHLDVPGGTVAVPRDLVEIRTARPHRFTVVYRAVDGLNPVQGTTADLGNRYAVCPYSGSRIRLFGHPEHVECRECGYRGVVAWWETG